MSNRRKGTKKESGGGGGGDGDAPLPPPPPSSSGGRSSSALQAMAALGGASHVTNAAAAAAAAASATSSSRSRSRGGGAGGAGIGIGAAVAPRTGVRYGLSRGASSSARYHLSIRWLTQLTQRSPTLAHLSPFIAGVLQLEGVLDQRYDKAIEAHAHTNTRTRSRLSHTMCVLHLSQWKPRAAASRKKRCDNLHHAPEFADHNPHPPPLFWLAVTVHPQRRHPQVLPTSSPK